MTVKDLILENYKDIMKTSKVVTEGAFSDEEIIRDEFDEYLNNTNADVRVCNSTFSPAFVLKRCDPIVYEIMFTDYKDEKEAESEEVNESVETDETYFPKPGDIDEKYGITFELVDKETGVCLGKKDNIYYIKLYKDAPEAEWDMLDSYCDPFDVFEDAVDNYDNDNE